MGCKLGTVTQGLYPLVSMTFVANISVELYYKLEIATPFWCNKYINTLIVI